MIRINRTTCFNCKSFDLLFVVVQRNANNIFSNSMFVLHVIMMHISILSKFDHILCRFEFWMFYMRFFFNIEIFWNDNIIWFESLLKLQTCCKYFVNMLKFDDLKNRYNRDFRIEFWNLKKHCDRDFRTRNIIYFDSYQFALKIWKSFSWMIQKKHDLMISLFIALMIDN